MGILITSILSHSNVKPKRVRISEDDSLDFPQTESSRQVRGTNLTRSGLVRRNAINRRWRRRAMPHNPSPADQGIAAASNRAVADVVFPVEPWGSNSGDGYNNNDEQSVQARSTANDSNSPRDSAPYSSRSSARDYAAETQNNQPGALRTTRHPPPPSPPARNRALRSDVVPHEPEPVSDDTYQGLTLPELETRADELRRTLTERHNINIDFSAFARRTSGMASREDPRADSDVPTPMVIEEEQEEQEEEHGDRRQGHNQSGGNEDQRTQSLMYEIRRRVRNRRGSRNGGASSRDNSTSISFPPVQLNGERRRSNIDEYDALMQENETEPSQNWRRRAFTIHRNNNLGRHAQQWIPMRSRSDGAGDTDVDEGAQRREVNRHAFVTSLGDEEDDEDDDDSWEGLPMGYDDY